MQSKVDKMSVHFSDNITYYRYDPIDVEENVELDGRRTEPRGIDWYKYFRKMKELLDSVEDVTVVFGNLGRYPKILRCYIDRWSLDRDITVCIRDIDHINKPCDLLVWPEPDFGTSIVRPPNASRLLVLSSHMLLETNGAIVRSLFFGKLYKSPLQFNWYAREKLWSRLEPQVLFTEHVDCREDMSLDLREIQNVHECYLSILNAMDLMTHTQRVYWERVFQWEVVLKDTLKEALISKMQECISKRVDGSWLYERLLK